MADLKQLMKYEPQLVITDSGQHRLSYQTCVPQFQLAPGNYIVVFRYQGVFSTLEEHQGSEFCLEFFYDQKDLQISYPDDKEANIDYI